MIIELDNEYYNYIANIGGIDVTISSIKINGNDVELCNCSVNGVHIENINLKAIMNASFDEVNQTLVVETNMHNKDLGKVVIIRGDKI